VGRGAEQDFQCGVVLLGAGAVIAGSVGQDLCGVLEGGTQDVSTVVDVGCRDITFDNARRQGSDFVFSTGGLVVSTIGLRGGGVRKVCLAGEVGGDGAQLGVDLKDLSAVDAGGVLAGEVGALRNIAGGVRAVQLPNVDLVLESDLNRVPGKGCGSSGGLLGADTGNTSNEEVCLGEIEQGRECDGGDGSGGINLGFTGDQLADLIVLSAVDIGEQRRETGDGDVASKEVEFRDIPPYCSFRLKLGVSLALIRVLSVGAPTIETMKTLGAKALPVPVAPAHSALPVSSNEAAKV
jgi:hypothetical protein